VIDFEVTANRPDCLSVAGMAREIATAYGLQVRRPVAGGSSLALTSLKSVEQGDIDIAIHSAATVAFDHFTRELVVHGKRVVHEFEYRSL
jgi:phenylalanyl-tRNA synthetase beta subunit